MPRRRIKRNMKPVARALLALPVLPALSMPSVGHGKPPSAPVEAQAEPQVRAGTSRRAVLLDLLAPARRANPTEVGVDEARAAVQARPRDADAWHQLGESLDVAGRMEEAEEAYERATRLPPRVIGRAFLYRDLAAAREKLGDLPGALEAAQISVRSWPLSRDGLFCAGAEVLLLTRLLVKLDDLDGAAAFYRPLYEARPDVDFCRAIYVGLTGPE